MEPKGKQRRRVHDEALKTLSAEDLSKFVSERSKADIERNPNLQAIRVYLMDGSYKAFKIDPAEVTVEELWEVASNKLMLTPSSCQSFFIWGLRDNFELLLYPHQRVDSIFKDWELFEQRYNNARPSGGKNIGSTLARSMSSLARTPSIREEPAETETKLVFRKTAIVPLSEEMRYQDSGAVHLFYIEAVRNVLASNYPCEVETAIQLGGIQLQLTVGDKNNDIHKPGYLKGTVTNYIPNYLFSRMKAEEWEHLLFEQHSKCKGKNPYNLEVEYLTLVRAWKHYGCTFFKGRYSQNDTFYKAEFEGKVRIGVNAYGIHIIEPTLLKIVSYTWDQLGDWTAQKQDFMLEVMMPSPPPKGLVNKLTASLRKKEKKVYFLKSNQAELLNDTMWDWLDYLGKLEDLDADQGGRKQTQSQPDDLV
eukprot:TRINITY_DN2172_c0_g1_i6.p1 TRINITY_DN2172_c0_g1~~TRINITY_DN2172_c0_g1_i6.p1  ORF type:complete len:420 (-),score=89.08 TRINITY_DN2172_c0_g1_i6:21-1280(-)